MSNHNIDQSRLPCKKKIIDPIRLAKTLDEVIHMNRLENLRLICGPCNLQKGGKF